MIDCVRLILWAQPGVGPAAVLLLVMVGCSRSEPPPALTPLKPEQLVLDAASSQPLAMTLGEDGTVHLYLADVDAMERQDAGDIGYWKWFMFRVDDAQGQRVRFRVHNAENGQKWSSLNPVVLEGMDPNDLAAYQTRPAPPGIAYGTNGARLPDDSGQAWKFVADSHGQHDGVVFTHRFTSNRAWVAMRYPLLQDLQDAWTARAVANAVERSLPAKQIDLGQTPAGRMLSVFRVGQPASAHVPTLVIYAREHAQDQDAGWAVLGALRHALSEAPEARTLRDRYTLLLIPTLDRDGAATGLHDRIRASFLGDGSSPEANAYIQFFKDWVAQGGRVDLTLNLHNYEADENPHHFLVIGTSDHGQDRCQRFERQLSARLNAEQFSVSPPRDAAWRSRSRLCGAIAEFTGAPFLAAMVNVQASDEHLTLERLLQLGGHLAEAFVDQTRQP